jgi:hypothetical protein
MYVFMERDDGYVGGLLVVARGGDAWLLRRFLPVVARIAMLVLCLVGGCLMAGCDLLEQLKAPCPEMDCSQCEITLGDCLDAGLGLIEGDE